MNAGIFFPVSGKNKEKYRALHEKGMKQKKSLNPDSGSPKNYSESGVRNCRFCRIGESEF